ncbi:Hypothetical protein GLP15_1509 [Giardia lamblia P15]|uniref:Uncharacterized protein n=1 Tax=Giardia intestinalis (strain P15) TaxID=658858 RepID=E1EYN2_GIAIA|nr:Hypothetical protein GLP15_1509 [Giardia lamblia P15]
MSILVNARLRASPILLHLKRPYRFADISADFEPMPGLSIYCAGTQTVDTDMHRLTRLSKHCDVDDKNMYLLLVHIYSGSADFLSAYSELAAKLSFNVFPYWDHEQAAYAIQELQRFSHGSECSLNITSRTCQGPERVLHILLAAGLSKPKIRSLCEHFKTLRDICTSSVKEIASLPGFSEETAATLLRRLGVPHI